MRGFMYCTRVARDQHGCRFLQQRFDDDLIFAGVSRHGDPVRATPGRVWSSCSISPPTPSKS
jgi:hypothetical protein